VIASAKYTPPMTHNQGPAIDSMMLGQQQRRMRDSSVQNNVKEGNRVWAVQLTPSPVFLIRKTSLDVRIGHAKFALDILNYQIYFGFTAWLSHHSIGWDLLFFHNRKLSVKKTLHNLFYTLNPLVIRGVNVGKGKKKISHSIVCHCITNEAFCIV